MRTKQLIRGLKNSQRIRVILNNVAFFTTASGTDDIMYRNQRLAVQFALERMVEEKITGLATTFSCYNEKMESERINVQVDLV
jgi:flagellar basal body rod protein FlgC